MPGTLSLQVRTSPAAHASAARQRASGKLNPPAAPAGAADAREHKLGATARSFAILEYVAGSHAPVDVLDIIAALKLPKATAYRLVDWFVCQNYLSREPGRRRLIVGPRLSNLAFGRCRPPCATTRRTCCCNG